MQLPYPIFHVDISSMINQVRIYTLMVVLGGHVQGSRLVERGDNKLQIKTTNTVICIDGLLN